jgi:hypothetical protein
VDNVVLVKNPPLTVVKSTCSILFNPMPMKREGVATTIEMKSTKMTTKIVLRMEKIKL